jgi:hypothetical protein
MTGKMSNLINRIEVFGGKGGMGESCGKSSLHDLALVLIGPM